MAQYSYDFSLQPVKGGPPAEWTEIGTSGKVSVEDHPTYGRGLRVTSLDTSAFDAACIWTDLGTVSRPLEVVARCLVVEDSAAGGGLLALADTTRWNAYVARLQPRSTDQHLEFTRYSSGARTRLWSHKSTPVVPNTPYWVRIRFNTDGTIDLKYWKDGDPEPSTWFTLVDATYSSGSVGVEIQPSNTYYYFWIGVGTNGDPAPTPTPPAIDTSASLALSYPTTSGQADELRNTSASLLLTSPQTSGQANELTDTSVAIQFDSPKVTGITGGFVTADAALQFSAPVVSASSAEIHDISAALTLASLQTAGQAEAIAAAVSASLRLASPAIAGYLGQIASVALQLSAVQVSGRSQMYPIAGGQIATGALSLAAAVDHVDIATGRTEVGALGLTASVTKLSSAQGSVKTGNLAFGAQIYHVAEATGSGLQVGALSLCCSLTSLSRLANADVVITDAVFAGVSVDDALHVHTVLAD